MLIPQVVNANTNRPTSSENRRDSYSTRLLKMQLLHQMATLLTRTENNTTGMRSSNRINCNYKLIYMVCLTLVIRNKLFTTWRDTRCTKQACTLWIIHCSFSVGTTSGAILQNCLNLYNTLTLKRLCSSTSMSENLTNMLPHKLPCTELAGTTKIWICFPQMILCSRFCN